LGNSIPEESFAVASGRARPDNAENVLCQSSGLLKRGRHDEDQRNQNPGAADEQQDFAHQIGVH